MRIFAPIFGIAGLALLTGLVAYVGFASVVQAVLSSEWGSALVVLARAIALCGCGVGWWFLLTPKGPPPRIFVALRFIREAINGLLPFAVVGGDIIGTHGIRVKLRELAKAARAGLFVAEHPAETV